MLVDVDVIPSLSPPAASNAEFGRMVAGILTTETCLLGKLLSELIDNCH